MKKLALLAIPIVTMGLTVTTVSVVNATAIKDVKEVSPFKDEYTYNSVLKIPVLEEQGQTYNYVVIFPDGTTSKDEKVLLNQAGTYSVYYTLIINNVPYHKEYSFIVKNQYYEFTSAKSFASYEQSERTYNVEGLYVSLAPGDSISFNQEIDIRGIKKESILFDFFAAPEAIGKMDFSELDIVFTDVADSSNYLKARFKATQDGIQYPYTYVDCGGNGQDMVGWENSKTVHVNSQFGTSMFHSFAGVYSGTTKVGEPSAKFSYDYNNMICYTNSGMTEISELDNSYFYSSIWDGFVSGKVRVTATAIGNASNAGFVIKSAYGLDLSQKVFEDETAPVITVNSGYDEIPHARVGYSYPIFDATAVDNLNGSVKVTSKAYYVNGTNRIDLSIVTDEDGVKRFNTMRNGKYEIVYTAKDIVGNEATKVVEVTTASVTDISVVPREVIVTEIKQGNPYTFPEFKTSGGSGKITGKYRVFLNGEELEIGENSFVPREIGPYQIDYVAQDITGSKKTYSYNLISTYNPGAAFDSKPDLPKYFISGYLTKLPELYATHYGRGGEKVLADVVIDDGLATQTIKSGGTFVPSVMNNQDNITVTYKVDDAEQTYIIPCVKVFGTDGLLKIANYFVNENGTMEAQTNRSVFTATNSGNASFTFANSLLADVFETKLRFNEDNSNFGEIRISLVDKVDPSQKITLYVTNNEGNAVATLNNKTVKSDIPFGGTDEFTVSYSKGVMSFNGSLLNARYYDDGRAFKGFSSGFVYYSVTLGSASAGASLYIRSIGNQTICEMKIDRMGPQVSILDSYGGFLDLDQVTQSARIVAGDVLDPTTTMSLSAYTPEKEGQTREFVTSEEGVVMNAVDPSVRYSIKAKEFGSYTLNYLVKDSNGNKATFNYSIGVLDSEAPVIKITSDYTKSCSVNDYIVVPNYTVSDNLDKEIKSFVTIKSPSGSVFVLPEGSNCMKAKVAGIYVVTINAMDEAGNVATFSYQVTVK